MSIRNTGDSGLSRTHPLRGFWPGHILKAGLCAGVSISKRAISLGLHISGSDGCRFLAGFFKVKTLAAAILLASLAASSPAARAQSLSPYWDRYPHFDEVPCSSDSQCTAGLKCQESDFLIYSRELCSRDYQCILPAVHLRNMRIELIGQCSAQECVYRPRQPRWCLRRRELSTPPIFSNQKCQHNFECPSGESCGRGWGNGAERYCGYLPATVWPAGTRVPPPRRTARLERPLAAATSERLSSDLGHQPSTASCCTTRLRLG